jgi:hypothetical protein
MVGMDVFLIILIVGIIIFGLALTFVETYPNYYDLGGSIAIFLLFLAMAGIFALPFIVIDKGSGATIGEITSVDKNFYGTTALYVKTSETTQEEYCIEDLTLAQQAPDFIGKKVKITYGERVGLYSVAKCSQAPVESIELVEE